MVKADGEYLVKVSAVGTGDNTKVEADALNSVASHWLYKVEDKTLKMLNTNVQDIVKKDQDVNR